MYHDPAIGRQCGCYIVILYMYILRLADALSDTCTGSDDSRLVIRFENTVTRSTSSLEVLGVDLNGAMSNCLWLALLILLSSLLIA